MTDKEIELAEREAMLEERKHGIGGSDIASVLGLSPWKTPLQLWEESPPSYYVPVLFKPSKSSSFLPASVLSLLESFCHGAQIFL